MKCAKSPCLAGRSSLSVVRCFVLPTLKHSIKTPIPEIRRGLVRLLGVIATAFHGNGDAALLGDLGVAANNANYGDGDFFANITHVQIHRRAKALRQVRFLLTPKKSLLCTSTLVNFVLPLVTSVVVETTKQIESQVRSEAIATLGAIARLLPWSHYCALIFRFLQEARGVCVISALAFLGGLGGVGGDSRTTWLNVGVGQAKRQASQENAILRTVCVMIDSFPVELYDGISGSGRVRASNKIHDTIRRKLLPAMHRHMVGAQRTGRPLRIPVAVATMKLALLLPLHQFRSYLPRLLADVANALRSRRQDVRDRAKKGYALICATLGPQYLKHAIQQLRLALREGYQVHVLGHAVHAVLVALTPAFSSAGLPLLASHRTVAKGGSLGEGSTPRDWFDEALSDIMPVILDDIFGAASLQKDSLQQGQKYD